MKMKIFRQRLISAALFAAVLLPNLALGQAATRTAVYSAPKEAINKIRDEGMNRSQYMQTLSFLTDNIGGRLTGSPSMKRANEWTRDKMKEWGMQNADLESWGPFGRGWALRKFTAVVTDPQYIPVIAFPNAWSPSTKGAVTSEVVLFDAKTEADLAKFKGKLAGKIVLMSRERAIKPVEKALVNRFSDDELAQMALAAKPAEANNSGLPPANIIKKFVDDFNQNVKMSKFLQAEGAAVELYNSGQGDGGTLFVQGASVAHEMPTEIKSINDIFDSPAFQPQNKKYEANMLPQVTVASEDYNRLVRMIRNGASPQMTVEVDAQYYDDDPMQYNTIAEIPGTDPVLKDEVVMLGAHLDSWHSSTGATDNGAGSAAVMEAARIILASGLRPRRTIRVALWSGEEQGLFGSTNYVKQHFGEKKNGSLVKGTDYDKLAGYFNLDNGTGKIRGVYLQGNANVKPLFEAWLAPFGDMGAKTLTLSNTGGTDHLPFDAIGLPGFQFIQDPVEYNTRTHHSNQDNFDRIQAEDMKQASTIIAAFAYQAAMMDEKLPRRSPPQL